MCFGRTIAGLTRPRFPDAQGGHTGSAFALRPGTVNAHVGANSRRDVYSRPRVGSIAGLEYPSQFVGLAIQIGSFAVCGHRIPSCGGRPSEAQPQHMRSPHEIAVSTLSMVLGLGDVRPSDGPLTYGFPCPVPLFLCTQRL